MRRLVFAFTVALLACALGLAIGEGLSAVMGL